MTARASRAAACVRRALLASVPVLLLGLTLAALSAPTPAQALQPGDAGRFDTWAGYDVGRFPVAVAAADFNGDGAPDAAWARHDWWEPSISVQLNFGEGTLGLPETYAASPMSNDIEAADIDGDGDIDLVSVGEGIGLNNAAIDLYLNDGTGSFTRTTAPGGSGPTDVVVADLDADGAPDLATANYWQYPSGSISVLMNRGDGTFSPETQYPDGFRVSGVAALDVDEDGDLDLASGSLEDESYDLALRFLLNDGSGAFTPAGDPLQTDVLMESPRLEAGDFDGDGRADLAAAGLRTDQHLLLTNQDGTEFSISGVVAGFSSGGLKAIDYDRDQDLDLLSATFGSSSTGHVSLLVNDGTGAFVADEIELGRGPWDVDAADFDGDGLLDLAVPNRDTGTGAIQPQAVAGFPATPPTYQTITPPYHVTTADFDGDGDTDVASTVVDAFGPNDGVQVLVNELSALRPGQALPTGGAGDPVTIAASDLSGDGRADLVWALGYQPYPVVYAINNGDGTFGDPVTLDIGGCETGKVTTADADNDGDQDLLVAVNGYGTGCYEAARTVAVVPGNGDGTFGAPYSVTMEYFPEMAVGGDLNGDQLTDVVSVGTGQGGERDVSIAFGTGGGAFGEAVHYSVGSHHWEVTLADIEGDDDLDILTADSDNHVSVLTNDGTGRFTVDRYAGEYANGLTFNGVALDVGDVNADGALDVAVANFAGSDVGVFYGRGDGGFDRGQIRYGLHSALRDIELADLNGDGMLDVVVPNADTNGTFARTKAVDARSAVPAAAYATAVTELEAPRGVSVLINSAGRSGPVCTISGTGRAETITGTAGTDVICGRLGDDVISGGAGRDILIGAGGSDTLAGGGGRDSLQGSDGRDRINAVDAEAGDVADGGADVDRCRSDAGDTVRRCP